MRILYNNLVKTATIAASSENENYLFSTALNDSRLSRYARTIDDSAEWIKFSFGSAVAADYILIQNHNFTSGATVKIQANATDVWTSPSFDLTLTVDDIICAKFSAQQTYQYWRIYIDDSSNPDTYLQISKIFLGTYLDMPGMNLDQSIFRKSTATARKSNSGQLYGEKRLKYKTATITFSDVTNTKKIEIDTFFDYVDIVNPFWLLIWEDDLDIEPPLYASLTKDIEWSRMIYQTLLWQFSLSVEECF